MSDIQVLSHKVIRRLIETAGDPNCDDHFAIDKWEWPHGVALYAVFLSYRESGDVSLIVFLRDWFDRALKKPLPPRNVNTTAPLLTLAFLAEMDGQARHIEMCRAWAEWIMHAMPRTEKGGLQHITSHLVNEGELWADTLFMTVLFLAKMGSLLHREEYTAEAEKQFALHMEYLRDGKGGLWFHGWTFAGKHHFGGIHWARGNAWFTAGAVEFLEIAKPKGLSRKNIVATLEDQIRALIRLQDASGLWHTILDDGTSYLETSASAAIAYGMLKAVRLGIAGREVRDAAVKAVEGVISRIQADGTVAGVSHGTAVGMNRQHYLDIPLSSTAYGQGLTFLMLEEYRLHAAQAGG
jgi:unsaturated rhamnogalacturonyl hydrolase